VTDAPNALAASEDFEFRALAEARNYRRTLLRTFSPALRGEVLEVGAGIGQLTADLRGHPGVSRLLAVEPDPRFAARFRATLPDRPLVEGTAAAVPAGTAWDSIVSVNVLEHIRDDAAELARWHALLAPRQGHLCLLVPARPELYAPIDRDFGHFRRYTRPQLQGLLREAGFAPGRVEYFNLVGYFAWWASFVLLRRRHFDRASVRLFDRAILPWAAALEWRLGPPPFGQSLIAVVQA
jgi:SAM-dependent methyltransferase